MGVKSPSTVWVQDSNSGCQTWYQVPLPSELPCQTEIREFKEGRTDRKRVPLMAQLGLC